MKNTFLKRRRSLPCVMVLLATAVGAWNLTQSSAQFTVETIRWIFAGADVGSNTYRTLPDGRFESTSEEKVANITVNSKLTGKITDGLLTEYELVNNQGGSEVKVTAKEGKAQITKQGNTYEVDFKPAKVLFANEHPLLTETIMGAALLERRRIPEKSGTLPNLPIAERGLRGRYELQTISYYQEATLYGSLRCCSRPASG